MDDNVNIKYQVRLCNQAMADMLVKFKMSGLDDSQIKTLLNLIGKALCRYSMDEHSIDSHISYIMEAMENNELN